MSHSTTFGRRRSLYGFSRCSMLLALATFGKAQAQALPQAPSALLAAFQTPALQTPALQTPAQQTPAQQAPVVPSKPLPADIAAPDTSQPVDLLSQQPPCEKVRQRVIDGIPWLIESPQGQYRAGTPCRGENPLQAIVSAGDSPQLTPQLKGFLAIRDVTDPFNLLTIIGYAGISVAANAHSDYGPGLKGWGRLSGYSLLEDMTSEFFGTFAIPSLVHEDPRYHRMPGKPIPRRIGHALVHTIISQHDDGRRMLNYATLLTYPISDELSNLYVPGLSTNAKSTTTRIIAGYATDPVGPLLAEFLPDVAKHIHIRIVFVQQILQQLATPQSTGNITP